jgi:hypothetical protein
MNEERKKSYWVISHERGKKDRVVAPTNETQPVTSVTDIL